MWFDNTEEEASLLRDYGMCKALSYLLPLTSLVLAFDNPSHFMLKCPFVF